MNFRHSTRTHHRTWTFEFQEEFADIPDNYTNLKVVRMTEHYEDDGTLWYREFKGSTGFKFGNGERKNLSKDKRLVIESIFEYLKIEDEYLPCPEQ